MRILQKNSYTMNIKGCFQNVVEYSLVSFVKEPYERTILLLDK